MAEIKIEIKSIFGKVLFEYTKENNTIKDTIEEAVEHGANLCGANLRGADLGDADLGGANLRGADLRGADLGGADLGGAGKINSVGDILIVGPLGSRSAYTQIYRTDQGVYVKCGCFFGTIDEFAEKVKKTHAGNMYERDYKALMELAKVKFAKFE